MARLLIVLITCLVVLPASAQMPERIGFQGYVVDEEGGPLNGTFEMTFRMYDAGNRTVWDEVQQGIVVVNGVFSVQLGENVGFGNISFSQPLWIGAQVGQGEELSPRIRLATVPYALAVRGMRVDVDQDRWNVTLGNPQNHIAGNAIGATIAGGGSTHDGPPLTNRVHSNYGTIGGGADNEVLQIGGIVAGGISNVSGSQLAVVGGGIENRATGYRSVIGGGTQNLATGAHAVVPGGASTHARGAFSFAAGHQARAVHDGSFVWSDMSRFGQDDSLVTTGLHQFLIRADGGVGIGTNAPSSPLTVAGVIESTAGGIKFPDGSVQTSASNAFSLPYEGIGGTFDASGAVFSIVHDSPFGGTAIRAETRRTEGSTISVSGRSFSPNGTGVVGWASAGSGSAEGVRGRSDSPSGIGVRATAASSTGENRAVWGHTISPEGHSAYFTGASGSRNYFQHPVGIGTLSPTAMLHLQVPAGEASVGINLRAAGSWTAQIEQTDDSRFNFNNGGGVRMTIRAGGNVGIGTSNPSERLHVDGRVRGSEFVTTSDARLKTDVEGLQDALEMVMQLRGVRYSWAQDEPTAREGRQIGFLAQEVRELVPEVVREDDEGVLSVAYSHLIPLLVEAMKEQQSEIAALREAVAELTSLVNVVVKQTSNEDHHQGDRTSPQSLGSHHKRIP